MLDRTRHICRIVDCRLMDDLEQELVAHMEQLAPPRVAVVNTDILSLGQTAAILEIIKRHYPTMRTVLCGDYPSTYPEHIRHIPRVDFALVGDPEPILRNLLDYIDVPQRLRRTPGLMTPDQQTVSPYFLSDMRPLSLPDMSRIYWREYSAGLDPARCRVGVRLTRGHANVPANRAGGQVHQPFRMWPMDRMAEWISKCAHTEINELRLTDPPGFWDEDRLIEWTRELLRSRNAQPWSCSLHPHPLSEDTIAEMREAGCKHIDLIFPSCDREVLARFELRIDWRALGHTLRTLAAYNIQVCPRFWAGGPEEHRGEATRIAEVIRRFGWCDYRVEPFPYRIDSPLYEAQDTYDTSPPLDAWIRWSREPWIEKEPVALWNGAEGIQALQETYRLIQKTLQRSPQLMWTRIRRALQSQNWIELLEDKALDWLQRHRKPSGY